MKKEIKVSNYDLILCCSFVKDFGFGWTIGTDDLTIIRTDYYSYIWLPFVCLSFILRDGERYKKYFSNL